MKQTSIVFALIHLLSFAGCTYIATVNIESILVTAWICSATGIVSGLVSRAAKEKLVAFAGFLTPIVAVSLTFLELNVLQLGPGSATLPFCVVFMLVQVITILISFRSISSAFSENGAPQITVSGMLLITTGFAIFFAIAQRLLQQEQNALMLTALSLLGLTFVGTLFTLYNLIIAKRNAR